MNVYIIWSFGTAIALGTGLHIYGQEKKKKLAKRESLLERQIREIEEATLKQPEHASTLS